MAMRPTQDAVAHLRRGAPPPVFRLDDPAWRPLTVPRISRQELVRLLVAILAVSLVVIIAQNLIVRVQERLTSPIVTRSLAANATATITSGAATYRVNVNRVEVGQTAPGLPPAAQGRTYVVVNVSLENTGDVGIAPGAWTLHMSDDFDRFPLVVPGADTSANDPLAPQQTMTRTLIFDVPTTNGQRVKWLYYKDNVGPQAVEFATGA